jgi:hypothetical protein
MDLNVNAVSGGREHPIAWIGLQPDGSISVGLRDRAFASPELRAHLDLWNIDNRVSLQYLVPDSPEKLRTVTNPHVTFHPPITFHLKANEGEELFYAFADVGMMLEEDPEVPWVRFASRPVGLIEESKGPRKPSRTTEIRIPLDSSELSVGLAVDFVRPGSNDPSGRLIDHFEDCAQTRIRVSCEVLPSQRATLAWHHQC